MESNIYKKDALHRQAEDYALDKLNSIVINSMLKVYKTILSSDNCFYCSSPITSGQRYINWLEKIGKNFSDIDKADESYRDSHFKEVIEPNRKHARQIVHRIRKQTGSIVIDPTVIPAIEDWSQQNWHSFWEHVIYEYVTVAVFIDGWQYSNGCVHEFLIAQKKEIATLDERMQSISLLKGIELIEKAIAVLKDRGRATDFLSADLEKIYQLRSSCAKKLQ